MKTIAIIAATIACFLLYERLSGLNKICIYQCVEGEYAITIDAAELCPISL